MLDASTGSRFSPSVAEDEANKEMPLRLFEGLPDYISLKVSVLKIYHGSMFFREAAKLILTAYLWKT
jgi:hypothetical protein